MPAHRAPAPERTDEGFSYHDARGRTIADHEELARIRSIAVPPAWTDVWICAHAKGHIQATGRDARGRKQYRYHTRWREVRDAAKYDRLRRDEVLLLRLLERLEKETANAA